MLCVHVEGKSYDGGLNIDTGQLTLYDYQIEGAPHQMVVYDNLHLKPLLCWTDLRKYVHISYTF